LAIALNKAGAGIIDQTGIVAFELGLDQVRRVISERRERLRLLGERDTMQEAAE
jgi:hypothetical protein